MSFSYSPDKPPTVQERADVIIRHTRTLLAKHHWWMRWVMPRMFRMLDEMHLNATMIYFTWERKK